MGGIAVPFYSSSGRFYPRQFRFEDAVQGFGSNQNIKEVIPETIYYVYIDTIFIDLYRKGITGIAIMATKVFNRRKKTADMGDTGQV